MPHCTHDNCRLAYFRVNNPYGNRTATFDPLHFPTPPHLRAAQLLRERENEASLNLSLPQRQRCSLRYLRESVYAYSFLSSGDPTLLSHWLRHYIGGLAIRPQHMAFAVHVSVSAAATALEETLALLERADISVGRQVQLLHGAYADSTRLALVNSFVSGLSGNAWVIFADSDEFFSFPCSMPQLTSKYDSFSAKMMDRLSGDGSIAPLLASPDISVQFPIECAVRQQLSSDPIKGQFFTSKIALFRAERRRHGGARHTFRTPHLLNNSGVLDSMPLGSFAHYTLTATAMDYTRSKMLAHQREAAQRLSSNESIKCSLRHTLNGRVLRPGDACPDYEVILAFMESQQLAPGRRIDICHLPAPSSVVARREIGPREALSET